jgi:hypothetical protein
LVNELDNKYCSKYSYPLSPSAFEEIKAAEDMKIRSLQEKYEQDIKAIREEMEDKFQKPQIVTFVINKKKGERRYSLSTSCLCTQLTEENSLMLQMS